MRRNHRKEVFGTGETAKILNVSRETVVNWFKSGAIRGYRAPVSRYIKIPRDEVLRLMKEHNMPTDDLEDLQPA